MTRAPASAGSVDVEQVGHRVVRAGHDPGTRRAPAVATPASGTRQRACAWLCPSASTSPTDPWVTSRPRAMIATRSHICCTSPSRWLDTKTVRPSAPSDADEVAELLDPGRVEPVRRLVEDEQRRVLQQRGGEPEPLLHARASRCAPGRPRARRARRVRASPRPRRGPIPSSAPEQLEVAPARERREQRRRLDDRRRSAADHAGQVAAAPSRRAPTRCPPVGRTRPSRHRIVVVLPEPFGPRNPNTPPSGTSRSSPATATVRPPSVLLAQPASSMTGTQSRTLSVPHAPGGTGRCVMDARPGSTCSWWAPAPRGRRRRSPPRRAGSTCSSSTRRRSRATRPAATVSRPARCACSRPSASRSTRSPSYTSVRRDRARVAERTPGAPPASPRTASSPASCHAPSSTRRSPSTRRAAARRCATANGDRRPSTHRTATGVRAELADGADRRAPGGSWPPTATTPASATCSSPAAPPHLGDWSTFRQYFRGVDDRRLWVLFEPDLLPGYAWVFPLPGRPGQRRLRRCARGERHRGRLVKARWRDLLERPAIRAALGAGASRRARTAPGRSRRTSTRTRSPRGRVLFVGDAAAVVDPMTGEGIAQALETGALAAEAIARGRRRPSGRAAVPRPRRRARSVVTCGSRAALQRVLATRSATRAAIRAVDLTPWTRRNFARWMFEDYPRALLLTPRRWPRGVFSAAGRVPELLVAQGRPARGSPRQRPEDLRRGGQQPRGGKLLAGTATGSGGGIANGGGTGSATGRGRGERPPRRRSMASAASWARSRRTTAPRYGRDTRRRRAGHDRRLDEDHQDRRRERGRPRGAGAPSPRRR